MMQPKPGTQNHANMHTESSAYTYVQSIHHVILNSEASQRSFCNGTLYEWSTTQYVHSHCTSHRKNNIKHPVYGHPYINAFLNGRDLSNVRKGFVPAHRPNLCHFIMVNLDFGGSLRLHTRIISLGGHVPVFARRATCPVMLAPRQKRSRSLGLCRHVIRL